MKLAIFLIFVACKSVELEGTGTSTIELEINCVIIQTKEFVITPKIGLVNTLLN